MYRQFDGYPDVHGVELANFLFNKKVVNGYSSIKDERVGNFNGASCLAASVISHFKNGKIGNIYLYSAGTRNCGEEYIYTIYPEKKEIGWKDGVKIKIDARVSDNTKLFEGYPEEFLAWMINRMK